MMNLLERGLEQLTSLSLQQTCFSLLVAHSIRDSKLYALKRRFPKSSNGLHKDLLQIVNVTAHYFHLK